MTTDPNEMSTEDVTAAAAAAAAEADAAWNAASQPEEVNAEPADEVAQLSGELMQWKDRALRAMADLDNYRKRMSQEKTEAIRFANSSLLGDLLPILDNFQFGLQAAQNDPACQNLLVGLNMVAGQLTSFLKDNGVEEVPAVGQPFDPNLHEAVSQQPSAEVAEGQVITVVRRGFRLRERLLRPASVVVSSGASA